MDKAVRKLPKAPSSSTTTAKVGFHGALPAPVFGWLIQYYLFIYVVRYDSNHKLQKNLNYYIFFIIFLKLLSQKPKQQRKTQTKFKFGVPKRKRRRVTCSTKPNPFVFFFKTCLKLLYLLVMVLSVVRKRRKREKINGQADKFEAIN